MNALPQGPLVAWYGDDFTGSSAVLEALTFAGLPSVLFLDIPTREQLELFPGSRGIGIASTARAHGPAWMDENLPPAFDWLRRLNAPVTHYKVCSTFDSAPHVGSIGRAIDIAAPRFGGDWIPLLIAVPEMRRYQCFGHFFAGSPQGVFRLDRHPVMARHPVTPMNESDVRLHLARQTQRPIGLIDIEALGGDADAALRRQIGDGAQIIAIDAMDERQLTEAGRLVWEHRGEGLFAVGLARARIRTDRALAGSGPGPTDRDDRRSRRGGAHGRGIGIGVASHRGTDRLGGRKRLCGHRLRCGVRDR